MLRGKGGGKNHSEFGRQEGKGNLGNRNGTAPLTSKTRRFPGESLVLQLLREGTGPLD